jgi:hypothetical protein
MIIWHACHELLHTITVFEALKMQSSVFFHQHVVIVHLHALLLDRRQDIFVLITRGKRVVGIVLQVHLNATLSLMFQWLSNIIAQWSAGAVV